jgi:hypothetical protein
MQTTARARRTAPLSLPPDIAGLLARFGLDLPGLLTDSNPKLSKGAALARPAILHHLPARALAAAIDPGNGSPVAPRGYLPELFALAEREGLTAAARAHHGCPWGTPACIAGCLNWAGHGGLSPKVAAARGRRTLALLADPQTYGRAVTWAACRQWAAAQRDGLPLALRLRGTDDTAWHRLRFDLTPAEAIALGRRFGVTVAPGQAVTIAEALAPMAAAGSLHLYEYSKAPLTGALGLEAQRAAGWDLTASFAADRATACRDGLAAVAAGFRLAVPVAIAKGAPIPSRVTISTGAAGFVTVPCIDGDATDHRWADPHGVAVILRTKRSRGAGPAADPFSLAPIAEPQALNDGTVALHW